MTGTYKFVVIGGAGGKETYNIEKDAEGGKGAQVTASINPVADETLTILVGGKGNDGPSAFDKYGGGGSGSFVAVGSRPPRP